jgi:ketosteroid isomerase-like protein
VKKIQSALYRIATLSLAAIFSILAFASLAPAQGTAVIRLFDGRTFAGWEGNLKSFRIEGGAIIGGTMKDKIPRNEFLCTTKEYGDFVMRLKFRLLGDAAKANAGIQFRSRRIPNDHEVIGYQADLGQNYYGALYDESRRKKVLAGPTPDDVNKVLKRDDWNEYEIRAEGRRIRLAINGRQTVDYTEADETIEQKGCICLQIHSGPPSEAWYKDIAIESLSALPREKSPSPVEQAILKLEQEWEDALVKSDVAALDRIYADGLIYTHSSGSVDDKATYIGNIKSGVTKYESMKRDDIKVGVYGDAAVVNCHWMVHVTARGNKITTDARYLHVYVKQKGRWRMVAHQSTRIAQ